MVKNAYINKEKCFVIYTKEDTRLSFDCEKETICNNVEWHLK